LLFQGCDSVPALSLSNPSWSYTSFIVRSLSLLILSLYIALLLPASHLLVLAQVLSCNSPSFAPSFYMSASNHRPLNICFLYLPSIHVLAHLVSHHIIPIRPYIQWEQL